MTDSWIDAYFKSGLFGPELPTIKHLIPFLQQEVMLQHGSRVVEFACGYGRNLRLLVDEGYAVEGVEINQSMVDLADLSLRETINVADAGTWIGTLADAVLIIGNSLGYRQKQDDLTMCMNAAKNLREGGAVVAEFFHAGAIPINEPLQTWYRLGEDVILQAHRHDFLSGRIIGFQESFRRGTKVEFSVLLYRPMDVVELLEEAGFHTIRLFQDFSSNPLNSGSSNIIAIARKGVMK